MIPPRQQTRHSLHKLHESKEALPRSSVTKWIRQQLDVLRGKKVKHFYASLSTI